MQQKIYLLRHGETNYNRQGRYQGQLDSSLTELGREQVQQHARMLKTLIGDAADWKIISSPLGRAMQSTALLCETIGYDVNDVKQDHRLTEVAVGQWAGLTMAEIQHTWPDLLADTDVFNWYFRAPGGACSKQVNLMAGGYTTLLKANCCLTWANQSDFTRNLCGSSEGGCPQIRSFSRYLF